MVGWGESVSRSEVNVENTHPVLAHPPVSRGMNSKRGSFYRNGGTLSIVIPKIQDTASPCSPKINYFKWLSSSGPLRG